MEYILNKIDMEVRERINQSTEGHKVHPKGEIQSLKKYDGSKEQNHKNRNNNNEEDKKFVIPKGKLKNSKIVITAVKNNKIIIDAELDKNKPSSKDMQKGNYLDIRR